MWIALGSISIMLTVFALALVRGCIGPDEEGARRLQDEAPFPIVPLM